MTSRIPENSSTWSVDRNPITITVNVMPPRDPNDDDDEDEDEDYDENQPKEPPVVREPDDE